MTARRLQLAWSIKAEPAVTLRVAFASSDRQRVDQHFGAAEAFAIYEVAPGRANLVGVGEFATEAMDGNEDKLAAKVAFLDGCQAVYVMAVGASAIKQLLTRGIQPIRVGEVDAVPALLEELASAMRDGGVAWVDKAIAARTRSDDRFADMADEGWDG
ncbi:nitrogen fixation protein NifX [Nitrogeniibacter mangrovi]|uniref:Nitrogen fixation protein NifX n=1 Tax=Nitrogeniibacter mangrovi TaxID=2016596 RepID=A0A6C1B6Y9_9RHOO|nr:NifB/NifX family molybdenum-iron cluster-binding protein [Nitrogeniibacter mangrovi]QID19471.1 nitrogen fixation protein NifX [Nitrogeniibacter mangrovi]